MSDTDPTHVPVPGGLASRRVRYAELIPCTTAFIDTRTPGSAEKENFTIIGPGVSESPDQHVHIDIPHGFNIGAARQPPGCVNSQHSHETAEVFVVHTGTWAFMLGENADDGTSVLYPGDTISIPIHVFRGVENVGDDTGLIYAVLGGDDPGHVTWAPYVFDKAREHGLILLEDGTLVDTTRGEAVPDGKRPQMPTTAEDVARLRRMNGEEIAECVVRHAELQPAASAIAAGGIEECAIIGQESPVEGVGAGKMTWPHGFHFRCVRAGAGAVSRWHCRHEEEVIIMHAGELILETREGELDLGPGDVMTVPIGIERRYRNAGASPAEAYFVRGGDQPRAATIID